MSEMLAPIFCTACGASGEADLAKVASLQCRCGSSDFGLVGVDPRPSRVVAQRRTAAPKGPGTGWGQPHPDRLQGWNEYAGPTPQVYPRSAPVADSTTCPVCKGSGYDVIDKTQCRECGGTGQIVHPTGQPPVQSYDPGRAMPEGGAGWRGASITLTPEAQAQLSGQLGLTAEAQARLAGRPSRDPYGSPEQVLQRHDPDYGRKAPQVAFDPANSESFYPKADARSPHVQDWTPASPKSGPYQMDMATCPECGTAPTELRKDRSEDAWWVCPHCGPLANIDRQTHIDPYNPAATGYSGPDRSMKTGGFRLRRKTGRLLRVLALIHERNELSETEAVTLARRTLLKHPEGR